LAKNFSLFIVVILIAITSCVGIKDHNKGALKAITTASSMGYKPVIHIVKHLNYSIPYYTIGNTAKPLLVLVHGAPGNWYVSFPHLLQKELLDSFCIVTYDRPGYGINRKIPLQTIEAQKNVLASIIDQQNISKAKVCIVARSYGTPIAAYYAATNSASINKLVFLGSTTDYKSERFFYFSYLAKLNFINVFLPFDLAAATTEKFNHKKELKKITSSYANITCNTFLLHGTEDWMASKKNATSFFKQVSQANIHLILIKKTGHNITKYRSQFLKQILLSDSLIAP
jgi:pimeloyl-ACP methyl ester carboxylesterase